MKNADNYTSLAPLYDRLMEDVDYDSWADYIDEILQLHHPYPEKILELACGTGSVAISLDEFGYYYITATDLSPEMVDIAAVKAKNAQVNVAFRPMNFLNIDIDDSFDAIYSLFDSVNYLHSEEDILTMLNQCQKVLKPGGLLIFDFSTPKNSMEAVDYLNNEEATSGNYRFFRTSRYDHQNKMHYNEFEIEELADDGKTVIQELKEVHEQRIYSLQEMLSIVEQTSYHLVAKYGDFELLDADEQSSRVTIVLRCQTPQ